FRPRRTRPHPHRPRGMGRHASARRRRIPLVPEAPFPHLPRLPPRTTLPLALAFAPPRTHPARPVLGIPAPLRFPQNQTRPSPPPSAPRPHRRPPSAFHLPQRRSRLPRRPRRHRRGPRLPRAAVSSAFVLRNRPARVNREQPLHPAIPVKTRRDFPRAPRTRRILHRVRRHSAHPHRHRPRVSCPHEPPRPRAPPHIHMTAYPRSHDRLAVRQRLQRHETKGFPAHR